MTELIWDGKYKDNKKQGHVRIALPFQSIETVNERAQDRRRTLELFTSGRDSEWRKPTYWGDRKYILPSLLPEFAGKASHWCHPSGSILIAAFCRLAKFLRLVSADRSLLRAV